MLPSGLSGQLIAARSIKQSVLLFVFDTLHTQHALDRDCSALLNPGCTCRIKDVCDGQKQIPFMKENDSGKWLYDSDKMVPYLEDKYPDKKKLGKPDECPQV